MRINASVSSTGEFRARMIRMQVLGVYGCLDVPQLRQEGRYRGLSPKSELTPMLEVFARMEQEIQTKEYKNRVKYNIHKYRIVQKQILAC